MLKVRHLPRFAAVHRDDPALRSIVLILITANERDPTTVRRQTRRPVPTIAKRQLSRFSVRFEQIKQEQM